MVGHGGEGRGYSRPVRVRHLAALWAGDLVDVSATVDSVWAVVERVGGCADDPAAGAGCADGGCLGVVFLAGRQPRHVGESDEVYARLAADTSVAAVEAGAAGHGAAGEDLLTLVDRYADLVAANEASAAGLRGRIGSIVYQIQQDAEDYRLISEEVAAKLLGDGWDDDAAEVAIVIAWAEHMAAVHADCSGRFCDAAGLGGERRA